MSASTLRRLIATSCIAAGIALPGVALAGPAFAASTAPGPVGSAQEHADALAKRAIVHIDGTWTGWVIDTVNGIVLNNTYAVQLGYSCTGFNVNTTGVVATAGHCAQFTDEDRLAFVEKAAKQAFDDHVYGSASVDEIYAFGKQNWAVEGKQVGSNPTLELTVTGVTDTSAAAAPVPAQIVAVDAVDNGDVALLSTTRTATPALAVGTADSVDVGTSVVAIGYPGLTSAITADATFKGGSVSAATIQGGAPYMEVSAAIAAGMSGGPTVDDQGTVIGINSFGADATTEAFNYVSAASNLTRLMSRNGIHNDLSPVDQAYQAGLAAYFAGDNDTAIDRLTEVTAKVPTNSAAVDYLNRARTKRDHDQPAIPLSALVLGGGGLLIAGVALTAGLARRRNHPVSYPTPQPMSNVLPNIAATGAVRDVAPDAVLEPTH